MNSFRVILPLVCGVFVYCVFSILLGPRSIWSMAQLEAERDKILANLESLYDINSELDARVKNLSADKDTIAMHAHEIGFVFEGERLVRLAGFSGGIDRKLSAGVPISAKTPASLPEWICKLFGFSGAAACFFMQSIRKKNKAGVNEPKKQDASSLPKYVKAKKQKESEIFEEVDLDSFLDEEDSSRLAQ